MMNKGLIKPSILHRISDYTLQMKQIWGKDPVLASQDWSHYFKYNFSDFNVEPEFLQKEKTKRLLLSTYSLVRYYRSRGHENAKLNPLTFKNYEKIGHKYLEKSLSQELKSNQILVQSDLDTTFKMPKQLILPTEVPNFLSQKEQWTLRQIQERLKKTYCQSVGVQFMHISNCEQRQWLSKKIEDLPFRMSTKDQKLNVLNQLTKVEGFSYFLNQKLAIKKRFGTQGLCSMIVGLNQLVQTAVQHGVQFIGFGMAHRGRVNILRNVFDKPQQKIFSQYLQHSQPLQITGDVNYHLGATTLKHMAGRTVRLSILPNPSHLQTVNPVLMGHIKAVNDSNLNKTDGSKRINVLPVLVHGDAALSGQGVVYQSLQMGYINHYDVQGVIHVVANNQVGFTTTPNEGRSTLYCTDIAKTIQAPVIHVNADQPQMVNQVMKIAVEYRQKFGKDIFVDVIGYRRNGHNEQDQPAFTQPAMYEQIRKRPNIYNLYKNKLISEGQIGEQYINELWTKQQKLLSDAYNQSRSQMFEPKNWQRQRYYKISNPGKFSEFENETAGQSLIRQIGQKITAIPQKITPHPSIRKIYQNRRKAIQTGQGIDFGLAEALAFGNLLSQGYNVRICGQDVQRGTFSHRHAVIFDQKTEEKYIPLKKLVSPKQQNRVQIQNSLLSQYAALGFQFGYSLTNPNTLTIWQAQFGDFSNGAQIMIDDYITSGQAKWGLKNGVVLNLPHGMDGQGPEHSSARPQRYLQLMNESQYQFEEQRSKPHYNPLKNANLHVICVSNAANLFHAYRRQMRFDFRKPLVNLVSKKLLKLRQASSPLSQLQRPQFLPIIGETSKEIISSSVKRVVICCGQAYYSLSQKRTELKKNDLAIIRVQQLAPFDYEGFQKQVKKYGNCVDFVWFQQEHRNSGAWTYLAPRLDIALNELKSKGELKSYNLSCVSRRYSASTAVGNKKRHEEQQIEILKQVFK